MELYRLVAGLLVMVGVVAATDAFGSSDDRFLKKYAMMKIYESCFGADVVKEIRQEMKAACAKCAALAEPSSQGIPIRVPPSVGIFSRFPDQVNQDLNQNMNEMPSMQSSSPLSDLPPGIDQEKLQQAIMSFRPVQQGYPQPGFGYRPAFNSPLYQPVPSNYYQPWGPQQYQMPFPQPYFQQPYPFYSNRISRDIDFRNRLEVLTARSSGKVRNVTCVMQELGYLDEHLEPNYEKISERISNLPVSNELKSDIQEGLQFCQQFAQCVPDTKRDKSPLSRELLKPMFFFRCYKHKKLEACVMKDIRERFTSEDDFETETDLRSISRVGRNMKTGEKLDNEDLENLMIEYLYLANGEDSDIF